MNPSWPAPPARPPWLQDVSEIIPGLYISDLYSAENPAVLTTLRITHVLSAMPGYIALPRELPLRHAQLPLDDLPFAELAGHLPVATAFLWEAVRDPDARVLVHCVEGVSRSVSVVCAFLMYLHGWAPVEAIQFVKSKRVKAEPNFGFVAQLHEYAELLQQAKRLT